MKRILINGIGKLQAIPGLMLARIPPSLPLIAILRVLNGIQLSAVQLSLIIRVMQKKAPCRLLVFGLGNDTPFWSFLNRSGKTVFLEDNPFWFNKITRRSSQITAYLVDYNTRRREWKELLDSPSLLNMSLPENVGKHEWDVIVVDAPAGYDDSTAGRMKSIYMASVLIKNSGDVFVHDCNREIEDTYSNTFLKKEHLIKEVRSPIGYLRHYCITNTTEAGF